MGTFLFYAKRRALSTGNRANSGAHLMQHDQQIIQEAWTLVHRCSVLLQHVRDHRIDDAETEAVQEAVWRLVDLLPRDMSVNSDTK